MTMTDLVKYFLGPIDRFDARPYLGDGSTAQEIAFLAVLVALCFAAHEFYSTNPLVPLLLRSILS